MQMLFKSSLTFVIFFDSSRCLFAVPNVSLLSGTLASLQSSHNTTGNATVSESDGSLSCIQLTKYSIRTWKMYDMITVDEIARTYINQSILDLIHFCTRYYLITTTTSQTIFCTNRSDHRQRVQVTLTLTISSGSNFHFLDATVLFIDSVSSKSSWRFKLAPQLFMSDTTLTIFKEMTLLRDSLRMFTILLLINDFNKFAILLFRILIRSLSALLRWIFPHTLMMSIWFRLVPPTVIAERVNFPNDFFTSVLVPIGMDKILISRST